MLIAVASSYDALKAKRAGTADGTKMGRETRQTLRPGLTA